MGDEAGLETLLFLVELNERNVWFCLYRLPSTSLLHGIGCFDEFSA